MERKNLEVKKSKNGKGVFAKRKFAKSEQIFEIKGKLIDCAVESVIDKKTRDNAIRYDKELYISPAGEIGDFINHSCNPNARIVKLGRKLFLKVMRAIRTGEEITFDYSTITAADDIWTMKCNCGEKNCRHVIGMFKKLPKKLREEYIERGMVPNYILD